MSIDTGLPNRSRESSVQILSSIERTSRETTQPRARPPRQPSTAGGENVQAALGDQSIPSKKRKRSSSPKGDNNAGGQNKSVKPVIDTKRNKHQGTGSIRTATRNDNPAQGTQSEQATADKGPKRPKLPVNGEKNKALKQEAIEDEESDISEESTFIESGTEESDAEETDTEDEETAIQRRQEEDRQYQVKPTTLPTWEESRQDIAVGKIVRHLCYDEDDTELAEYIKTHRTEKDDEPQEGEDSVLPSIEGQEAFMAEEKRHREAQVAKKELQRKLEQKDPERLNNAYQYYKHDPAKNTSSVEDRIHQDGARRPLQQHQMDAAYFMLHTERYGTKGQTDVPLGGGILGDQPGFGKVRRTLILSYLPPFQCRNLRLIRII